LLSNEDTKLRRRRRGKEALGDNIHAIGGLRILRQASLGDGALVLLYYPPPSKKACPQALSPYRRERKERKEKKSSIWRLIAILINIGYAAVL